MAEAAVVENPAARFFCHQCSQEVSAVLPDYLCSRCHSGFIEELAQPPPEPRSNSYYNSADTVSFITDSIMHAIGVNPQPSEGRSMQASAFTRVPRARATYRASTGPDRPAGQQAAQGADTRAARSDWFLQNFILQSLVDNYGIGPQGNIPVRVLNLHGNPGDYVWGRGGWNAIISQLINQLDGTGPPPLPREKIEEIPTVNITEEQVEKNLQCTVCMEDFKLGEPVRLLPCQHHFHKDCIIPWLQLHGTCPICRKLLMSDGNPSSFGYQDPFAFNPEPGPSGVSTRNASESSTAQSDPSTSGHANDRHESTDFDYSDEL